MSESFAQSKLSRWRSILRGHRQDHGNQPIIPQSYNPVLSYQREEAEKEELLDSEEQNKMVRLEMENLAKMTRVRHSTGGGSGAAKNPASPSKASKASLSIGSSPLVQK